MAICNVLRVSGPGINPGTRLIENLGAQSADLFELSCSMQRLIGAEVDFRKLFRQKCASLDGVPLDVTLQEIVDYLQAQLGAESSAKEVMVPQ